MSLLRSLRELETPSNAPLGFSPLDKLLDAFQNPPITRQQQQYHTQWSTQHQETHQALPTAREKPPLVIEITGATACSGKTQLLYHVISVSLLPSNYKDTFLFGKGHAVALFDLSSRFSILRLYNIMRGHVSSICSANSSTIPDQELSSLISDSLTHLHIFRPQESSSLLATLENIPSYLLAQPPTHFSTNRPLGILAINDLSAFLWQDRLEADEESGLSTINYKEKANNSFFLQRYRNLVSSLRHFQHLFSCTIIATNWGLAPVTSVVNHRALRPHLPSVWNNFCTVKVVVERDRVPKFGPGRSAEEVSKEKEQRWEEVERSGFSGWVNWWGSEDWREAVREGIRGLERGGSFSFKVTEKGIVVIDNDS
ncbi:hypothetical protein OEA41_002676 [Lepraria neglecta]|uniref:DNA recombination and repair protein Rad51-like C-terminal domain-containing protein n=1 Tax=Lepraria neglecta TaxID=209136 RepID=A0AAD9Z3G7_9LECA|nr:hypothetical protein OEA41_002676 [Lepraria neglecta]